MLCFQSLLSLVMSGVFIQRYIVTNVLYSTFTDMFIDVTFLRF